MEIKTPHINANKNDFARTVLMPGDPLRSKFIAENFLEDYKLVNDIRGVKGYTGYYKNTKVTVMASGMGMASIGIYANELYSKFDVENIIRIGSAGSISSNLNVKDLVVATGAYTMSNYYNMLEDNINYVESSSKLVDTACDVCNNLGYSYHLGDLYSTDTFYNDRHTFKFDALAVEMEAAGLLYTAKKLGKNALTLVTISDSLITKEELDAIDRQTKFKEMMEVALNIAVRMDKNV